VSNQLVADWPLEVTQNGEKSHCEKKRGSRGLVRWNMAIDYLVGGDWNHGIL